MASIKVLPGSPKKFPLATAASSFWTTPEGLNRSVQTTAAKEILATRTVKLRPQRMIFPPKSPHAQKCSACQVLCIVAVPKIPGFRRVATKSSARDGRLVFVAAPRSWYQGTASPGMHHGDTSPNWLIYRIFPNPTISRFPQDPPDPSYRSGSFPWLAWSDVCP